MLLSIFLSNNVFAFGDLDYRSTNDLSPNDYLFGSYGKEKDPVFDSYRTIDLNVDLGIGSDCGKINFKNTIKGALKNILDTKYLGDMGKNILAASPMLATCYFSPTWCSILKHARVRASFLAQLRFDQCRAINKYVDGRVSDFYEERSKCSQRSIRKSGGNLEKAMESCTNFWDADITNWSGDGKSPENRLIESTAKWAGFKDKTSQKTVSLVKAFIGDTIIKKGFISVDYGPRRVQLTPRTYLMSLKNTTFSKLCKGVVKKVVKRGGFKANIYRVVTDRDLLEISGKNNKVLVDRQTLISLAYMPYKKRNLACKKLSDALAMSAFSSDMSKTLDFISSKMGSNPHLPENRKNEVERKRKSFKDQVEMTLALENKNNEPLNRVLFQINSEGAKYRSLKTTQSLEEDHALYHENRLKIPSQEVILSKIMLD